MVNYCNNLPANNFWCLLKDQEKQNKESESKVDTDKNVMNWLLQQKPKNGQTNEGLEKSKKEKPKTSKTLVKIVNYRSDQMIESLSRSRGHINFCYNPYHRISLSGYEKTKEEKG